MNDDIEARTAREAAGGPKSPDAGTPEGMIAPTETKPRMTTEGVPSAQLARTPQPEQPSWEIISTGQKTNPILEAIEHLSKHLTERINYMSASLEALETSVTSLESEDAALAEAVSAAVSELKTLEEELARAKEGGTATPEQLEALTKRVEAVNEKLSSAVSSLKEG